MFADNFNEFEMEMVMSIDLKKEKLLSFNDAAKLLPRRRGGKSVHVSTLHRWAKNGCKHVCLEYTQVGGTRCTSIEALARFFQKLNDKTELASPGPTLNCRRREVEKANRALESEGL